MATTTAEPPATERATNATSVASQLAKFERRRALRHPLNWVGALLSLWMMWILGGDVAPILERDSVFLAGAMLPLAATALLVANYATLRLRRTPDILGSYPSGPNLRILGIHLGVIGPALLAFLLQAIGIWYLITGGPIGSIDWWELAVGPVMVAVFGMGGVLPGRWLPHPIVAPVALVGLGFLQLMASPDAEIFSPSEPAANFEWLAPWMTPSAFVPIEDLALRPSQLHLVYLVALALLVAGLALQVQGMARLIRVSLAGLFLAATIVISFNLPSGPGSVFDWPEAAASQTCATERGIEYCAFGFYEDWIPRWQETVAAVDAVLPVAVTNVMQRPVNIGFDEPGVLEADGLVLTSTFWDRKGATPLHSFDLALRAAHSSVGLPTTLQIRPYTEEEIESILEQNPGYEGDLRAELEESEAESPKTCSALGQARAVVAVWLAASALDGGEQTLEEALARYPAATTFRIGFGRLHHQPTSIGRPDAELAVDLLAVPIAEVQAELDVRWEEVTDPATTSTELASWFGLPAPEYPESDFFEEPCR